MSHKITQDQVYNLIPSAFRMRDAQEGEPLKALAGLLAEQFRGIESDIDQSYDNLFIETCDEWVVPYIGELLGVKNFHPGDGETFSLRRFVGNALAYRRRKGTVGAIEQLARDITAYPAKAVEFFQRLIVTQNVNHTRLHSLASVDLRDRNGLERLDTPFSDSAHTFETRLIQTQRGKFNIKNVGLFLWRLHASELTKIRPKAETGNPTGRYHINPLGLKEGMFHNPESEEDIETLAGELNVPDVLRRYPLFQEFNARRKSIAEGESPSHKYFDPENPSFAIYLDSTTDALPEEEVLICDLSEWKIPSDTKTVKLDDGSAANATIRAAIDPELGRLALPDTEKDKPVLCSYYQGSLGDLGGGDYDRSGSLPDFATDEDTWRIGVSKRLQGSAEEPIVETLAEALQEWNDQSDSTRGLILILDSDTYDEALQLEIAADEQLAIVAAHCPEEDNEGNPAKPFGIVSSWSASSNRPLVSGSINLLGTAAADTDNPGSLYLNGLWTNAPVQVDAGNLGILSISHCSIIPDESSIAVQSNPFLNLELERSICAPVVSGHSIDSMQACECLFENAGGFAISLNETSLRLDCCTVFGKTRSETLFASNCIFTERILVSRQQEGCVRYCFLMPDSVTPRRYQCIPNFAYDNNNNLPSLAKMREEAVSLRPRFTSESFAADGNYRNGFGQLIQNCPQDIIKGADNRSEVGAYNFLRRAQREENLGNALAEYLPVGLEAGIFYVT